jgi:probable F420-dependent oxidoreductase
MRVGLVTPVLTQVPGVTSDWEATATVADLVQVATEADRLGFHHLTCSEHVAVPAEGADRRGSTYWDPLATLGHLAAVTSRIRLATHVVVLGYHHPLQLAKSYGTLDVLSGGRVVLGVGVGTLAEEFALLGAPFEGRGARADDALRALRAALGRPVPSYAGEHYRFEDMVVRPHAVQAHLPIWVGGRTLLSLRRAAALADGWSPFGLAPDEVRALLDQVALPPGFEVVLHAGRPLDPGRDPDGTVRTLTKLRDAGATVVGGSVAATSADDFCTQLQALQSLGAQL